MTIEVIEAVYNTSASATSHTVTLATTPQPGDVVVGYIGTGVNRTFTTPTGLGATWTSALEKVYVSNNKGGIFIGTGANASGVVTFALSGGGATPARIGVLLVRGLPNAAVTGTSATDWSSSGVSTANGIDLTPARYVGPGLAVAFGMTVSGGTVTFPAAGSSSGWVGTGDQLPTLSSWAGEGYRILTGYGDDVLGIATTAVGQRDVGVVYIGDPVNSAAVESSYVEALTTGTPSAVVESSYVEVLTPRPQEHAPLTVGLTSAASSASAGYASRVLADAPYGYWKLNETSGTTMSDSSGNGRHGTYSGATLNQASLHSGAFTSALGGASGQGVGSVPGASFSMVETLTASFFVKFNNTGDAKGLVSRVNPTTFKGWVVWQRQNRIGLSVLNGGGQQDRYGPAFTSGQVAHVAIIQDGIRIRLLVDGVEVMTSTLTGTYAAETTALQIGGYAASNYSSATFSDVAYWTRALSVDDIYRHLNGGSAVTAVDPSTVPGLVARYDAMALTGLADGDPITTWSDTSGNNKHASNTGGAGYRPTYKTNIYNGRPVVRFDGVNNYFDATVLASGDNTTTVIAVFTIRAHTTLRVPWSLQTGNAGIAAAVNASGVRAIFGVGVFINYAGGTMTAGTFERQAIVTRDVWTDTNGSVMRVNGAVTQTDVRIATGGNLLRMGSSSSQGFYANADIAELLVFDRPLSERDNKAIDLYLQDKWEGPPATTGTLGFTVGATAAASLGGVATIVQRVAGITNTPNLTSTPQVGDVVVLALGQARTDETTASVSGLGATWSRQHYFASSETGLIEQRHEVWVGTGATSAGTITIARAGGSTAVGSVVYLIRDTNGSLTASSATASSGAVTGPTKQVGGGQVAISLATLFDGASPVYPSSPVPATGWTTAYVGSSGGWARVYDSYRVPAAGAAAEAHSISASSSGRLIVTTIEVGGATTPTASGSAALTVGLTCSTVEKIELPATTGTAAITAGLNSTAYGVTDGGTGLSISASSAEYGLATGEAGLWLTLSSTAITVPITTGTLPLTGSLSSNEQGITAGQLPLTAGASGAAVGVATGLLGLSLGFSMRDAGVAIAGLPIDLGQQVQTAGAATVGAAFTVGAPAEAAGAVAGALALTVSTSESGLHQVRLVGATLSGTGTLTVTVTRRVVSDLSGVGQLLSSLGQHNALASALGGTGTLITTFDVVVVELAVSTEGFGTLRSHLTQSLAQDITVWFAGPVTESHYATGPAAGVGTGHGPYLENDYGFSGPED